MIEEDFSLNSNEDSPLDNLRSCLETLTAHGRELQRQLANLESGSSSDENKSLIEHVTSLRISTDVMIASCSEYVKTAEMQEHKWNKALERERTNSQRLQEMVEQLAKQHTKLEQTAHHIVSTTNIQIDSFEQDDYADIHERLPRSLFDFPTLEPGVVSLQQFRPSSTNKRRRCTVPDKPYYPSDLWSILKKCVGKDLWKISMPVSFNEPISMLQRLAEDYEYADLLDTAAECSDPYEQLAYVAAFSISSYSTTANRTGKPFNPLLGETFEFDRTDDLGWRLIAEQVSHHPPVTAIFCEAKDWKSWQDISLTSKFRGKDLHLAACGVVYVEFSSGHQYSWTKVNTTVHNIIVGKLWIDHYGDTEIIGHNKAEGLKCSLTYYPYSYFSKEKQRKVNGVVTNEDNAPRWLIRANWDEKVQIACVARSSLSCTCLPEKGTFFTIWNRRLPAEESEKYYNFTVLACQLNEPEDGVAPTDSRLRPDQRLMEQGQWDESNLEKTRLEEKQRAKYKSKTEESVIEEALPSHEPLWFNKRVENDGERVVYTYKGNYWNHKNNQDWSMCPDIF